jgi:uncharacterized protein YecE (DUF72 family)
VAATLPAVSSPDTITPMRYWIGTSGYNYPEWRGSFYPEKFPTGKMLAYYAARFDTVEVNYTFYRMPTEKLLDGWAQGTPDGFTFTLKAPRRITHDSKLQRCEELTQAFVRIAGTLGPKLGVLLFQLPPTFKRNDAILAAFLQLLPAGTRAAFEFRHESWHDATVFAALRARNLALCIADSEKMSTPVVATADYSYFRLRDEGYQAADVGRWGTVISGMHETRDAYVYFKHEEQGKGPEFATQLIDALGGTGRTKP